MNIAAQENFVLDEGSVPGITSVNTRFFDHDGLWGYINGGADLYLEYGFEQITVFDIKANDLDYKADIYKMTSPEAVFGIFSISRYKCNASGVLCKADCVTPYQYIAARGPYYFSVSNATGSPEDSEFNLKLAAHLLGQMAPVDFDIPSVFNSELLSADKEGLKLVTGPLGMQNGFARWDRLFAGFMNYKAWILPVKHDQVSFTIAQLTFGENESLDTFLEKNGLHFENPSLQSENEEKFRVIPGKDSGIFLLEGSVPDHLLIRLRNGDW